MSALAVEAGVSRRTAGRAKGVLWDFEDAIVRRDRSLEAEPNGEAARLRGELSGTLTKLQQKNAEITRLRAELKACRVALLSEENEQLRRFRHWTGGHTPVVRECRVMTDQEPPVLAPMLAGATGMPTDPTGWIFEPTGTASEESAASGRPVHDHQSARQRRHRRLPGAGGARRRRRSRRRPRREIVAFDDRGRPSFERLQSRMHVRNPSRALMARVPVLYLVFDLLWADGRLLTGEPLVERRRQLESLQLKGANW